MSDPIELSLSAKAEQFASLVFGGVHRVRKFEDKGHFFLLVPHGTLATFDDNKLTLIVFASHRLGLRAEIDSNGMRGLKILLHNRTVRIGRMFDRHPTLADALDTYAHGDE